MATILVRNLGTVADLREGEWLSHVVPHRNGVPINVTIKCPECGALDELNYVNVQSGGRLSYEWKCPYPICPFSDWLILSGWGEA